MTKTIDENWSDWYSNAFPFGYGTGEEHIIPALKKFFELCEPNPHCNTCNYDHEKIGNVIGHAVVWLIIGRLCAHEVDVLEYGTSPRYGWLTSRGMALRAYMSSETAEELYKLACGHGEFSDCCCPDACNCGPNGYVKGRKCSNPFWDGLRL